MLQNMIPPALPATVAHLETEVWYTSSGICHSYTADGRCISLLKVLYTNKCIYNCAYCANKVTNNARELYQ